MEDDSSLSQDFKRGMTVGLIAALNYTKRLQQIDPDVMGEEMIFFLGTEIQKMLPELLANQAAMNKVYDDINKILSRCRCSLQ